MQVRSIYTAMEKGEPMEARTSVRVVTGAGIEGDRYATGRGAFSKDRPHVRQLSLISEEALTRANAAAEIPFEARDTRRNLLVSVGVDTLNALLGVEFTIGDVRVRGTELCDPCVRPSKLCGKPGFREAFAGMGGLRVTVLSDGDIAEGDAIVLP